MPIEHVPPLAPPAAITCPAPADSQNAWILWGLDVGRLRERAKSAAWAETLAELRAPVEELKKYGLRIPRADEPSGWGHNYTCPKCAVRLTFDRASAHEHRCPLCQTVFRSTDLDEAWIYLLNGHQISAAHAACILAAIAGDEKAADLAGEVLAGYARMYSEYQAHGRAAGQGRVQGQSLDEATWMLSAVRVYRFLRDNHRLTDAEAVAIRENMFVPAIALLKPQTSDVHNIHVWHAAAIMALADVAGRPDDIAFAEKIIRMNLERGVLPDGSWMEGSPLYHFYTLQALTEYALAARAASRPLILPETIQKMFASPIQLLLPDKSLPLLNDGQSAHPLAMRASQYEMGQYLFGGLDAILSVIYRECGTGRTSMAALLYGQDVIREAQIELKRLAIVDGVALVRRQGMTGLVKATPYGGYHDHPDKPGLYLYREGSELEAADIGTSAYGIPMHKGYYRTTASHNTIMVDGKDQQLAAARITLAKEEAGFTVVQALADGAYPGIAIRRTVLFGDGWALDWTACRSQAEHSYLWLFHANGALSLLNKELQFADQAEPMVPNQYVSGQRRIKNPASEIQAAWVERDGGKNQLFVQLWPAPGRQEDAAADGRFVGVAESPDLPSTRQRGLLVAGRRAENVDVIAFFCWGDTEGRPPFVARLLSVTPDQIEAEISRNGKATKVLKVKATLAKE